MILLNGGAHLPDAEWDEFIERPRSDPALSKIDSTRGLLDDVDDAVRSGMEDRLTVTDLLEGKGSGRKISDEMPLLLARFLCSQY